MRSNVILALTVFATLACCDSSTMTPSGSGGGTTTGGSGSSCGQQTGVTSCRGITCQAGNYCSNAFLVSEYCKPGCTADANCGANEFCGKCAGENVGSCLRCGSTPSCGQGSKCKQDNTASSLCAMEGKGSDGYSCTNSDKPVGQCTQSSDDPSIYCCGAVTSSCSPKPATHECDDAFVRFRGSPGDYGRAFSCSGAATPAGVCRFLTGTTWCCT